jgi:hypothetical protein
MAGGGQSQVASRANVQLDSELWHAYSSHEHGGRVFWMHAVSGQRTWAQPLPDLLHIADAVAMSARLQRLRKELLSVGMDFEQICWVCTQPFGSTIAECKTIAGDIPSEEDVLISMEQIASEFARYPATFPSKAGLDRIVFCSRLHYGGQRRGHVPSFHSRTMYIDCMAQPMRRVVSSFHHELWHFADYVMLGRDYEFADAEWCTDADARARERACLPKHCPCGSGRAG